MHHRGALTPSLEQQWSDEVRYLHSLWHQATPSNPNPKPTPKPKPKPISPISTTSFKKENKKKKKKKKTNSSLEDSNAPPVSNADWSCEPAPPPQSETGWPALISKPESTIPLLSIEEQAKLAATQLQQRGLQACQEFFSNNSDSDDEEEDSMEEYDSDEEDEESEFFLGIFKEDNELRNYYEKNFEAGEFCCLVCGGIGKKVGKRFKHCVALVQHSIAISKTKRRRAHRAFGQAICQVLGWNINRLPTIVLSLDAPLCQILENNDNVEESVRKADNGAVEMDNMGGLNEVDANELYKDLD